MDRRGKPKYKAPMAIVPLANPDKGEDDLPYSEGDYKNPARFPGPFRCCIIGRVNSGKSLLAKHILMAHQEAAPKFEEVYVVHGMADKTDEYTDLEPTEVMAEIPSYEDFDKDSKKLLIIDDYDFVKIDGATLKRLSELFRFGSSHQNTSIILLHQSWFRVPKIVKDCCNVFIIYRPVDKDELACIGRRVGLKKDQIQYIFDAHMPHFRDSLCINLIPGAPRKFYKNLFEPLDIEFEDGPV